MIHQGVHEGSRKGPRRTENGKKIIHEGARRTTKGHEGVGGDSRGIRRGSGKGPRRTRKKKEKKKTYPRSLLQNSDLQGPPKGIPPGARASRPHPYSLCRWLALSSRAVLQAVSLSAVKPQRPNRRRPTAQFRVDPSGGIRHGSGTGPRRTRKKKEKKKGKRKRQRLIHEGARRSAKGEKELSTKEHEGGPPYPRTNVYADEPFAKFGSALGQPWVSPWERGRPPH